jgi:hypothetical protein
MIHFETEISQPPHKVKVVPEPAASMDPHKKGVFSEQETLAPKPRDLRQTYYLEWHLFW